METSLPSFSFSRCVSLISLPRLALPASLFPPSYGYALPPPPAIGYARISYPSPTGPLSTVSLPLPSRSLTTLLVLCLCLFLHPPPSDFFSVFFSTRLDQLYPMLKIMHRLSRQSSHFVARLLQDKREQPCETLFFSRDF